MAAGIQVDQQTVMISTPLDKYKVGVYELAEYLENETSLEYSKRRTE